MMKRLVVWGIVVLALGSGMRASAQNQDFVDLSDITDMQWSPDQQYIATAHDDGIALWDGITGRLIERVWVGTQTINSVSIFQLEWSPDSTLLAVLLGEPDGMAIQVIDVEARQLVNEIFLDGYFISMTWNPEGTEIIFVYKQNITDPSSRLLTLNPQTGELLQGTDSSFSSREDMA